MYSFNDKDSMKDFNEEQPKYFKPADKAGKKGMMRVAFLSPEFPIRLVYSLKDKNVTDGSKNFRGTFLSLTAKEKGFSLNQIKSLLRSGDPEGQLLADVKIIGKAPQKATILPVLKYSLDSDGVPDKDHFQSMVFDVGFMWVSDNKFNGIQTEVDRFRHKKKGFQELDFIVTSKEGELTWDFRADDDSLYGQYRTNEKLAKKIEAKLSAEYKKLNVTNLEELVDKFLAQTLTEDQWIARLTQYGYMKADTKNFAASKSKETAPVAEDSVKPQYEEDLFSDDTE